MNKNVCWPALLAFALLECVTVNLCAATFELRGTGNLPVSVVPAVGVPGEEITVSVQLDSADFGYVPLGNPIIHYFAPSTTIPVSIVGSISGEYTDVSPIGRFVALELEGSSSQGDMIGLDVSSGTSGTSLFTLSTQGESGFDGSVTPHDSPELFELFEAAMNDDGLWNRSTSSAVLVGASSSLLFLGELEWTLINPLAGDLDADADVDGRDFLAWQRDPTTGNLEDWQANYSAGGANPNPADIVSGDFDGDSYVDGRDFLAWQRDPSAGNLADWQASYAGGGSLAANVTVPEPTSLLLTIIGTSVVVGSRRSRRGL